jgi:hypothetical protein
LEDPDISFVATLLSQVVDRLDAQQEDAGDDDEPQEAMSNL